MMRIGPSEVHEYEEATNQKQTDAAEALQENFSQNRIKNLVNVYHCH